MYHVNEIDKTVYFLAIGFIFVFKGSRRLGKYAMNQHKDSIFYPKQALIFIEGCSLGSDPRCKTVLSLA